MKFKLTIFFCPSGFNKDGIYYALTTYKKEFTVKDIVELINESCIEPEKCIGDFNCAIGTEWVFDIQPDRWENEHFNILGKLRLHIKKVPDLSKSAYSHDLAK